MKNTKGKCIEDIIIENDMKVVVKDSGLAYYGHVPFIRKTDAPVKVGDKLVATIGGWIHEPA